jgi:uncharacterized protein YbbK (DUF523 family)
MKKIAISACLLGIPCRWNAKSKLNQKAINIASQGNILMICPEILAGLTTPRPACEIIGGDGRDVLIGKAKIVDKNGKDYSKIFIKGAKEALSIIKKAGVKEVILKSGSPTCGGKHIYDGTFSGNKKLGLGVFAALLKKERIKFTEID